MFDSTLFSPFPKVHEAPPPPAPLHLDQLLASEPQYISPESVRQNKKQTASKAVSTDDDPGSVCAHAPNATPAASSSGKRTDSPDTDSAFCEENTDSNSSNSSNGKVMAAAAAAAEMSAALSSIGKVVGSLPTDAEISPTSEKAEKIRLAIEKMKEASVKKIFIKG